MTAESPENVSPPNPEEGATAPRRRGRHWIWATLYLAIVIVLALSEGQAIIRAICKADLAAGKAINNVSITSLGEVFVDRFEHCEYRSLVICEPRADRVPMEFHGGLGIIWDGAIILPRLPDAIWYVLKTRFELGDVIAFVITLIFVAVNIFGWLGVLCDTDNSLPMRLVFFLVSIIWVPAFLLIVVGLVQFVLVLMTSAIGLALQALLLVAVIPGAIVTAFGALHLGLSLSEAFEKTVEFIRHPFE